MKYSQRKFNFFVNFNAHDFVSLQHCRHHPQEIKPVLEIVLPIVYLKNIYIYIFYLSLGKIFVAS